MPSNRPKPAVRNLIVPQESHRRCKIQRRYPNGLFTGLLLSLSWASIGNPEFEERT